MILSFTVMTFQFFIILSYIHNWIDNMREILKIAPRVTGKNHLGFIDELYKNNKTKDFAGFEDIDNAFGFE